MTYRNGIIAAAAVIVLGVALHQLLGALTESRRVESVRVLEETLAQMRHEPEERSTPAAVAELGHPTPGDACAAWEEILALLQASGASYRNPLSPAVLIAYQVRWGEKDYDALTDEDVATLAAFVTEHAALLDLIREVTANYASVCRIPFYRQGHPYWMCERYLSVDLLYRRATGEFPLMIHDLIALCSISQADYEVEYPFLMHGGTQRCLRDAIASGTVDDALWEALLRALEACRSQPVFVDKWVHVTENIAEWFADPVATSRQNFGGDAKMMVLTYGYRYGATPLMNYHVTRFGHAMAEILPLTSLPYYEAEPALREIGARYGTVPTDDLPTHTDPGWWFVCRIVHSGFADHAYMTGQIDLARFAILLDRYHRDNGHYPDSLDALAAGLGGHMPLNPCLGEPYHYEDLGDVYRLWYEYWGWPQNGAAERWAARWPGEHEQTALEARSD
jgi:hypothetical protein